MTEISRIAVFRQPGIPIDIIETAIPDPAYGEILVRILYTTLCRSDILTFSGKRTEKSPTILGHEIIGKIIRIGPGAPSSDERGKSLKQGDRITWAIYSSDPDSTLAKRGMPQKAKGLLKYGHEQVTPDNTLHGGLSDFIMLRKNTAVVKIDDRISNRVAAPINCAFSTVASALRVAGETGGRSVAVIGAGMLGSVACAMCRVNGASRITAYDIDDKRLEKVRLFGADIVYNLLNITGNVYSKHKAEIVLEFSGSPDAIEKSVEFLTLGGIAVWAGATFPQRDVKLNAEKILRNLNIIRGIHNYTNQDLVAAVEFIESHYNDFPFDQMIEKEFKLDQVNDAFEYAVSNNPIRVGINVLTPKKHQA